MKTNNSLNYILLVIILWSINTQSQRLTQWEIISPEKTVIGNNTELLFKVDIKPFWHIYSVNTKSRNGKNTSIWFRENSDFKITEQLEAIYEIEYYNRNTNQMEYIIEEEGGFAQKIKVLKPNPIIKGQINYVLCNRSTNQEIAHVYYFEIQLKTKNN
tara:strand:+ start:2471 stop:2944 length:474 start_codon:yes stop_codon:yes gene_type:complete